MIEPKYTELDDLLGSVTFDYAMFMDKHLQELFPVNCEDKLQFIKDHEIHLRNCPTKNISELWMDDKRVGTFSQRFENNGFIFEFTK